MCSLFSYVVEHDCGTAPNPFGGYCTLVKCKPRIIELAEERDWIVGTGGSNKDRSAGHGKLVYAMRVDERIPFARYRCDKRFHGREDTKGEAACEFALVSKHFFYFGKEAIRIPQRYREHPEHPLEKRGPAHRSKFSPQFIADFTKWLERTFKVGRHGNPCCTRDRNGKCRGTTCK